MCVQTRVGTGPELCPAQLLLGISMWLGLSKKQNQANLERLVGCDRSLGKNIYWEHYYVLNTKHFMNMISFNP